MKDLAREKIQRINELLATSDIPHNGLLSGALGLAYYYYHTGAILDDPDLVARGENLLMTVFEEVNGTNARLNGTAYANGATGFAYTVCNLQRNGLIDFDLDEEFADLDEYLFDSAYAQLEQGETDYLHGAMGAFHYFSARRPTAVTDRYLNRLATLFMDKAVVTPGGIYFVNKSLERLNNKADLGLAHGLSGLLLLLIAAWPRLQDQARAEELIRTGIAFILQLELPAGATREELTLFPFTIGSDAPPSISNRLAWCYGDLNIALLLVRAGNLLNEPQYLETAERIGLHTLSRRTAEDTLSTDSHFCHGSAGLAQFYKCLYRETGNEAYLEPYGYWISETIAQTDKNMTEEQYKDNPVSLLDGWAGVGIVLADYLSGEHRNWSEAFLL
ncbi:lanthionine synthetase LanC family protein [Taibaiella chishuiensis]|uniref:Lanthionine synthetase-like protein n=1 Tax=Taibaiella chishuiensis TaxID=1434707 RepID=A0A2P8D7S7_9BACT|nr:lanthionine synthetase LanC family protein [Taibaiella chishuiensis]PSK93274.1 lanthionine synthetase-like protein [Taibaiella chishuiensis]